MVPLLAWTVVQRGSCRGILDVEEPKELATRACPAPKVTRDRCRHCRVERATRTNCRQSTQPANVSEGISYRPFSRKCYAWAHTENIFRFCSFCDFWTSRNSFIKRFARTVVSLLGMTESFVALLLLLGPNVILKMKKRRHCMCLKQFIFGYEWDRTRFLLSRIFKAREVSASGWKLCEAP